MPRRPVLTVSYCAVRLSRRISSGGAAHAFHMLKHRLNAQNIRAHTTFLSSWSCSAAGRCGIWQLHRRAGSVARDGVRMIEIGSSRAIDESSCCCFPGPKPGVFWIVGGLKGAFIIYSFS